MATKKKKAENKAEGSWRAKAEFRDINDFGVSYKPGADVSDFDADRLQDLKERGLVEEGEPFDSDSEEGTEEGAE